jgi:signal transduction histidine kinase
VARQRAASRLQGGEIRQVLANLISNAIDSMPTGGTLHLAAKAAANGLNIEISDTGRRIPVEIQRKILEPFLRQKGATVRTSVSR